MSTGETTNESDAPETATIGVSALGVLLGAIDIANAYASGPEDLRIVTLRMDAALELVRRINAYAEAYLIVTKMRADLTAVGGYKNKMIMVPAGGIRDYIMMLEAALAPNVQGNRLADTGDSKHG